MAGINFDYLTAPKLITELSYESILAERKNNFLSLYSDQAKRDEMAKTLLRESEPVTKLLEESAYRELIYRQQRNEDIKSLMVLYSSGTDLENLVADRNIKRLVVSPADNSVNPPLAAVMETDDDLRYRYILAMDGLSVAGPKSSYQFFAKSADGRVGDVSVSSPEPYLLNVYILQNDSETGAASKELIDIVQLALSDESVRPCCDRPTVQSVEIVNYSIQAKIFVAQTAKNSTLLQQAREDLDLYIKDQRRIGRSIRQSAIYSVLHISGVEHVEIISPSKDIVLNMSQAAYCTNINIQLEAYE